MIKRAHIVEYQLGFDRVQVIGIHRTDRGSKYRGRSFVVFKEGKSKEEFAKEMEQAVAKLLDGTE